MAGAFFKMTSRSGIDRLILQRAKVSTTKVFRHAPGDHAA
jgi:hypothetical protein